LLLQAGQGLDGIEPHSATRRDGEYLSGEDAPTERSLADADECCHFIRGNEAPLLNQRRSFHLITQRLVLGDVVAGGNVVGLLHEAGYVDSLRHAEVALSRGGQVLPSKIRELGLALDEQRLPAS